MVQEGKKDTKGVISLDLKPIVKPVHWQMISQFLKTVQEF